ncbi:MAG TPA: hypothetical protein VJY62_03825 [Bacteroidia bacterium]|nr:hypothetical protein [Bacteroidia bacterium]
MNKIAFKFIFCFFLIANFCDAQIKIQLLNGKMKDAKQYELKGDWVFFKRPDSLERKFFLWKALWPKDKLRKLDKFDVFSAINADGSEDIIYDPDTSFQGDPSVERVRNYIKGEQYAMTKYPGRLHSDANNLDNHIGASLIGAGSAWVLGYYGPIGVFAYSIVLSRFNPKVPFTNSIEPEVFNSPEFTLGYQKYARNKKIKQSLMYGGISFTVGFAAFVIFK